MSSEDECVISSLSIVKKIKRPELYMLFTHGDYIKSCNPLVTDVYCSSVYFLDSRLYLDITLSKSSTHHLAENIFLRGINAMCHTNFVFDE